MSEPIALHSCQYLSILISAHWHLIVIQVLIFLMNNTVSHSFTSVLAICLPPFVNAYLNHSLIINELFFFLWISYAVFFVRHIIVNSLCACGLHVHFCNGIFCKRFILFWWSSISKILFFFWLVCFYLV
jgi:hypothetical protein